MARPRQEKGDASASPASIVLIEPIGWMENGVMRHFNAGQQVSHEQDIYALIERGANFRELK